MVARTKRTAPNKPVKAHIAPSRTTAQSTLSAEPHGKSIFLFADGTGNSSAKLFKTNVWRMYEAIALGPAEPGKRVQIGYYDNGVGTSNFRPLALLGGIFGFGLKANVLRLYAFLCRNYQPGDRIYAFGFSRGAFTIRLLVDMVASRGILRKGSDPSKSPNESELSGDIRQVYRDYRRNFVPNWFGGRWIVGGARWLRDVPLATIGAGMGALLRWVTGTKRDTDVKAVDATIHFVGVWDTVAAYGGPFAEFTRGVDDWVFPLTMRDYTLSPKVHKARHALSLDDERDAFWPLLWDEVNEQQLTENGAIEPDRLKQVWFAGVHSDVGGGYPDESLSYIPLLWMMDELGDEVDFLPEFVKRAQDLANPYGPIHDSRAGFASYYRYQPRKIAAFTDPPSLATLSLRDPGIRYSQDDRKRDRGLLTAVHVHDSVLARILLGVDSYAPAALPGAFRIEPPADRQQTYASPYLTTTDREWFADASPHCQDRYERQENAWNQVWRRRIVYFATVIATCLLVAVPLVSQTRLIEDLCSDDRCFARSIVSPVLYFVPPSFGAALEPWIQKPLTVIILGPVILALMSLGRSLERRFRQRVKSIWRDFLDGSITPTKPSKLRVFRESAGYQRSIFAVKWIILPFVCGMATLAAIALAFTILATQLLYAGAEPRRTFCKPPTPPAGEAIDLPFDLKATCTDLGIDVAKGQPYQIRIDVDAPWKDDDLPADPVHGVRSPPLWMKPFAPLKRVTSAGWLQVLTEVRESRADTPFRRFLTPVMGPPIDIRRQSFVRTGETSYTAKFCPRWDGRLYIMLNDAAPLLSDRAYSNNQGAARVSVTPLPDAICT